MVDPVHSFLRLLPQKLDPRLLRAGVVLGGLDQVHERHDGLLEPLSELPVGDTTLGIETTDDNDGFDWGLLGLLGLLGLIPRKRKDVVVDSRPVGTPTGTGRGY